MVLRSLPLYYQAISIKCGRCCRAFNGMPWICQRPPGHVRADQGCASNCSKKRQKAGTALPGRRKQAAHIRIPAQHRGLSDHGGNPGDRILQIIYIYTKMTQGSDILRSLSHFLFRGIRDFLTILVIKMIRMPEVQQLLCYRQFIFRFYAIFLPLFCR